VKQEPGKEMPEFCRNREADVPRFASDGARSPPPEAQQKISGRLTSNDVTQNRLDIRGYIDTARKLPWPAATSRSSLDD
jgi:transposase